MGIRFLSPAFISQFADRRSIVLISGLAALWRFDRLALHKHSQDSGRFRRCGRAAKVGRAEPGAANLIDAENS
jgi:hypothetical protein